jgi:hypothetical protein
VSYSRFAEDTSVPVAKSRGEIDRLLREWGAKGIQWSDDFEHDTSVLRFVWRFEDLDYLARFTVRLPGRAELEEHAIDGRTGRVSERKLEALLDARGKREHRLLLLWLKAALNAVEAGLVTAETLFLPFLEGRDGQTVGEIAVPRLTELTSGSAIKLLGPARIRS